MSIRRLEVIWFQKQVKKKDRKLGKEISYPRYYLGHEIEGKKFVYISTKLWPKNKSQLLMYKNNFYAAYQTGNNYILISTKGISVFNLSWKNRFDFEINPELNLKLSKLNKKNWTYPNTKEVKIEESKRKKLLEEILRAYL